MATSSQASPTTWDKRAEAANRLRERNKSEGELHGAAVLQHGTSTHSVISGTSQGTGDTPKSGLLNRLLDPPRARPKLLEAKGASYPGLSPTSASSNTPLGPESPSALADGDINPSNLGQRLRALEKRFDEKLERRLSTLEHRTEQRFEHLTNKSDNDERKLDRIVQRIVKETMAQYQDLLPQLRELPESPRPRGSTGPESPRAFKRFEDDSWHPVPPPPILTSTHWHSGHQGGQGGGMEFPADAPAPSVPVSSRPVLPTNTISSPGCAVFKGQRDKPARFQDPSRNENRGRLAASPDRSLTQADSAAVSTIRGMRTELDRVHGVVAEFTCRLQSSERRIEAIEEHTMVAGITPLGRPG